MEIDRHEHRSPCLPLGAAVPAHHSVNLFWVLLHHQTQRSVLSALVHFGFLSWLLWHCSLLVMFLFYWFPFCSFSCTLCLLPPLPDLEKLDCPSACLWDLVLCALSCKGTESKCFRLCRSMFPIITTQHCSWNSFNILSRFTFSIESFHGLSNRNCHFPWWEISLPYISNSLKLPILKS